MTGIIVAFPKLENAQKIQNLLIRSGFKVLSLATTGAQVMAATDGLTDGIVVCGYKFPDMMYDEIREDLPDSFDMMLVAGRASLQEAVGIDGVVCVEMPIKAGDVVETLAMMAEAAERRKKKRKSAPKVRSKEEQDIIAEAKAILIERNNMTEDEAHRYLQKTSMDTGASMVEAARIVMLSLSGSWL
ncbi:MAG: ANTAR domain-containing protein [Lachnospiraceae bacterium]|nr:ANTAR domain-containing protein [Lachnospiraceae bacterium]